MTTIKFTSSVTYLVTICTITVSYPPTCDNDIYCQGDILHTVQTAHLYEDSKTFVDMKMKIQPDAVKKKFKSMMDKTNKNPSKSDVRKFVDDCFDAPGSEFSKFHPEDWKSNPKLLNRIDDDRLKEWAKYLNGLWKSLGRKMKAEVKDKKELYSILYVPNAVIVPGGRFREFYYWDSYWIILGLLHSEMKETAKGMLENFIQIIKEYGLIPNGGRIYYIRRSQPPLMIPMVKLYFDFTNDKAFIRKNIDILVKEFQFWMDNRCVDITVAGKTVKLARYNVETAGPRPESYREDLEAARRFSSDHDKEEFYAELKSACESGWDFSTRWFVNKGTNKGNLTNVKTRSIIPVDLNAMLCWNARILQFFFKLLGNADKASQYGSISKQWKESIQALLWSEEDGFWFDYDNVSNKKRRYFYGSNIAPLWTGCYYTENTKKISRAVITYMGKKVKIDQYEGGVPTSLENSGEQWDFPNAWPPLQHMIIEGMENTGTKESRKFAYDLAFRWIRANFKGYLTSKGMFEKYDAQIVGGYGGGGEYAVQLGFGWTNGVCLDLLHKYGSKLDSTGISGASIQQHFIIFWRILIIMLLFIVQVKIHY